MSLREVTYTDREGRKWRRLLPEHEPDSRASVGIPDGPPPLTRLMLPLEVEVRLHNELFNRGFFHARDLRRRGDEVQAAIQAALSLDRQALVACFAVAEPAPEALTPVSAAT